jgi:hypothetical protein
LNKEAEREREREREGNVFDARTKSGDSTSSFTQRKERRTEEEETDEKKIQAMKVKRYDKGT